MSKEKDWKGYIIYVNIFEFSLIFYIFRSIHIGSKSKKENSQFRILTASSFFPTKEERAVLGVCAYWGTQVCFRGKMRRLVQGKNLALLKTKGKTKTFQGS